jgi:hypothetical protein
VNQSKQWPSRPTWVRCIPSIFLPPLLAILLVPGAALGQPRSVHPAVPDQGIALLEGVVMAPRQGFAYVMRPGGGIDAVDLASGAVRWRSDSAAKPLALAGDRLIAQAESRGANALDLVVLDARSGAARDAVRIPLPAGIAATVVDTPAGSFRVRADSAASKLVVRWEATNLKAVGPAQGYLPAENEGQAPTSKALAPTVVTGEAVVDLAAPSPRVKTAQEAPSVRSAALARAALQELQTPVVAGTEGRQLLSADGRHVLVTEPIDTAELTLYRHRWTVYERDSGARLGSVPALVSATPFLVVGTTLYHMAPAHAVRQEGRFVEHPAALRAVNLTTGAEAWNKAVRETSYRGPFPP